MAVIEKKPDPFETVVRTSPDDSFFMVTLAFATTAPVVSIVVPLRVPVSCCPKLSEEMETKTARQAIRPAFIQAARLKFVMELPPIELEMAGSRPPLLTA